MLGSQQRPAPPTRNQTDAGTPSVRAAAAAAIDDIVTRLEKTWKLGLKPRDKNWSPSTSDKSKAEVVYGKVKRLYFSPDKKALDRCLEDFNSKAGREPSLEAKINLLDGLLTAKLPHPRAARPPIAPTPRDNPPKTLLSPLSTQAVPDNRLPSEPDPDSVYTTAPETGSPTDEEDENAPQSPTLSSFSARRRAQASPRVSLGSTRKRPSDAHDDPVSPKLARSSRRTSRTIMAADMAPIPFKIPTLDMANSYKSMAQAPYASSSVNASFNNPSAQTSFGGSTMLQSSQESAPQVHTANTSFSSDFFGGEVGPTNLTRTSSATIGSSLDDEDLLEVTNRMETLRHGEDMTREVSSSYNSISSQIVVEAAIQYEERSQTTAYPASSSRLPQSNNPAMNPPPLNQVNHARGVISPAKPSSAQPASPAKSPLNTPVTSPEKSPGKPPGKIAHQIRNLPDLNLFIHNVQDIPPQLPYFIAFICCRVAMNNFANAANESDHLKQLLLDVEPVWSTPETFWAKIKDHYPGVKVKDSPNVWSAWKRDFDKYTFRGKLVFNRKQTGPLFNLELQTIQADISCRFQRAWGSDRFLYLDIPALDGRHVPQRFKTDENYVLEYWKKWYLTEHSFLGRKWRAFDLKPIKKASATKTGEKHDRKMILFATEGLGIDRSCSIGELLNWFMPFGQNDEQSFCKAYARIDLGLSRTKPTLVFQPSQVEYVEDILADGTAEATEFNDPLLPWTERADEGVVMNDGCSVMSVGAAQEIWRAYRTATGTNDPMPSAFQGRIGGAKGLWMVSAESYSKDPSHTQIWIKISASQLKFKPHPEDLFDETFDPNRLTFELCNYSSPPVASDLHISFISIMTDRGVPIEVISKLMTERLDLERAQLLGMLPDPVQMYHWAHKQNANSSRDDDDVRWQAALPHSLGEKVRLLLEAGFSPTESPYLARCLQRSIANEQLWREKKLRTPLGKSTYLYGLADPFGVLEPGEVHVQFSTPLIDDITDERYLCLDAMNLLVARQPACRRSDIQKVRSIVHPKLTHLADVVVFPSKGQYPLAGKLQGGDYDGDKFWLCWENALVEPFQNAPAPLHSPTPANYGIKQDKRKVKEIMNPYDLATVDELAKEVLEFRMNPSLLGIVTNYLEKRAYLENRIHSEVLDRLCDMHDLLVDAPKNGYSFNERDFRRFVTHTLGLKYQIRLPVYKEAMGACEDAKEMGDAERIRKKEWRYRADNVLDYLYFRVIRAHNVDTMQQVMDVFKSINHHDDDLYYPCRQLRQQGSPIVDVELNALNEALEKVYCKWNGSIRTALTSAQYNTLVDDCYAMYLELKPSHINHPDIKPWIMPYLSADFSLWETIKASTLYTKYPSKSPFVFHMCGRELARLKAQSRPGTRSMVVAIHANTKPKPIKPPAAFDDEEDEDFGALVEDGIKDV